MKFKLPPVRHVRHFIPVVDPTGGITGWGCSECAWRGANPARSDREGAALLARTMEEFLRHQCQSHRLQPGTKKLSA